MSYIVPMKKPICINCPFRSLDSCTLIYLMSDKDGEVTGYVNTMTVSPDCPLVEIPTQHGRLIDADRIDFRNDAMHDGTGNLVVTDDFVSGVKWVNDCIERTPSAIPAPHGNLKDESDIISLIEVMFCRDKDGMEHAIQCVKDAPTVIEAEGET